MSNLLVKDPVAIFLTINSIGIIFSFPGFNENKIGELASAQAISASTNTTLAFATEIFDQNADFASNTFTAPVTGKYQLSFNIRLQQLQSDSSYVLINIQTSNRTYQHILAVAPHVDADVGYQHFSNSLLCDMDANDTASVTVRLASGAAQTDLATDSYFSGYLVA